MPTQTSTPFVVANLPIDSRIRVFRRFFSAPGEFDELQVDAYCITTRNFIIICDTLLCPEDMQYMLQTLQEQLAGRQLLIINSHADWDHTWGNSYVQTAAAPNALLIAHALCAQRMNTAENQAFLQDYQQRFPLFKHVAITTPRLAFTDTLSLDGGDLQLELLHTPGHCSEHCSLWLPALRVLLAFDAAESPFPTIGNIAGVTDMFETLEKLVSLQPVTVLCSHGQTSNPDILTKNLSYLRTIAQRAKTLLASLHPDSKQLEQAAELINYPYAEVIANHTDSIDHSFYREMHAQNVRYVLQWLLVAAAGKSECSPM
jgi:glyoxylase-like metal-dependent hydrolase (beta-lactamase superfamily II)